MCAYDSAMHRRLFRAAIVGATPARRTLTMPRNEVKPAGIPSPRPTDTSAYGGNVSVEAVARPPANQEFRPQTLNTDDLDIPTFLRNRR